MKGQRYDQLDYAEAEIIERDYVCAQCWGSLVSARNKRSQKKAFMAWCPRCGEDRGFVTRHYAETKRAEDAADRFDAERNLGELLGIKKEKLDPEKAINQLWPE